MIAPYGTPGGAGYVDPFKPQLPEVNTNRNWQENVGMPIITSSLLTPQTPIVIPKAEPDTTNYHQYIADGTARIGAGITDLTTEKTTPETDLQKQLNALMAQPSSVEQYNAASTAAGFDTAQANVLAQRNAVRGAQAELAGIQAQVQAIVDSAKAQNLKLEQNASGGLITTDFLSRQQQEVNRQSAIAALPLQALALSAQAKVASLQGEAEYAQSTLKAAQDKLDTTFRLMSEDSTRKQTLQLKMLDIVIARGDKKEAARAELLKSQISRNQSDLTDVRNAAQSAFQTATNNGQADLYAQFIRLAQPDINSKTFSADLQKYNEQVAALQGQIKTPNEFKTAQDANGNIVEYQLDPQGRVVGQRVISSKADSTFSPTQSNNGASNAGVDLPTFKALPADVQNLFINNEKIGQILVDDVGSVKDGSLSHAEALADINAQSVPQGVKDYFTQLLGAAPTQQSGGGFWDWVGGFFK